MNDKIEEKIIKATINFIRTNGYQTVSLRKISQAAGVTTGAFYKRFKNKDVLFYRTAMILSQQFVTKTKRHKLIRHPRQKLLLP